MADHLLPKTTRLLIMTALMFATMMNQVDTTIANVALPHIQGTTSSSREQISWVLTSYIIAMAIATPLTGWLADKFGRRRMLLLAIGGFTIVSGLCGTATSLAELVIFRFLQGAFGAALMPIAQVILMNINTPAERGKTMAIFSLGFILGPLIGPLLGGYLTENFSWHWVFLINLPVGIAAFLGIYAYLPELRDEKVRPFDLFGFSLLAISIGCFQLMLDRGQTRDWFTSTEINVEGGIAALGLFLFVVHAATARHPFVRPAIFSDRNFTVCLFLSLAMGILMFGTMSLLPTMLAGLFGQPIMDVGIAMAPRGLGTFVASIFVGRLMSTTDLRYLILFGLVGTAVSSSALATLSLQSDMSVIIISGLINGFAMNFIFAPLTTCAFATLPKAFMNEGSAIASLIRYIGMAAGISAVQVEISKNAAVVQSRLTEGVRPDNPVFTWAIPDVDVSTVEGAGRMVGEATRQGLMTSYVDIYWALALLAALVVPTVFLLRVPEGGWLANRPQDGDELPMQE